MAGIRARRARRWGAAVAALALVVLGASTWASMPSADDARPARATGTPGSEPTAVWAAPEAPVTAEPRPVADRSSTGGLHTEGSSIVDAEGRVVTIRGISWFGMETPNCAPHGLWTLPLDEGMAHIAALGFTTVRLPFSNECLAASATTSIDPNGNPDLVGLAPLELMDTVIARAKAHGLTVILDRHRPGSAAQSELWYTPEYSEQRWIDDWRMLAARYRDEPAVIGVDLHNEPHGVACWGCGDPTVDWPAAATRAGNAVLAENPDLLVIVEGVERQGDGTLTWWGGGLADAGAHPVVLDVADRVVYSPHEYPSTVYPQPWFSAPDYPANLESRWDADWGYLARTGIAPVLVGEFGTRLETESDRVWLATLVDYLARTGQSFAYWSFNPNSGDTGGIVGDDWRSPQTAKLDVLRPLLGPASPPAAAEPPATPSPDPSPAGPAPTPPSAGPHGAGRSGVEAIWSLQSAWGEGYVAEIAVTAGGATSEWTLSWVSPGATGVVNAWGMDCTVEAGVVTCTGSGWAAALAAGQTVRVGVQIAASSAPSVVEPVVTAN